MIGGRKNVSLSWPKQTFNSSTRKFVLLGALTIPHTLFTYYIHLIWRNLHYLFCKALFILKPIKHTLIFCILPTSSLKSKPKAPFSRSPQEDIVQIFELY